MSFNFTDEDLQKASDKAIFNGGKAGRVKNVTVTMEEAGVDGVPDKTNENAPDFKVWFTDSEGNKINRACFGIDPMNYPNQWGKTYKETMKKEWAWLNKLVEHTGGQTVMSFNDDKDLFTQIKQNIGKDPINVFVNYGSSRGPKGYLEPRKWLPAVEALGTPDAETKLVVSTLDSMSPVVADAPTAQEESWI